MNDDQSLNFLALNQNIFGKGLIIGQGYMNPENFNPLRSLNGIPVFVNGITAMPRIKPITDIYGIGKIKHPYAMIGMPDQSAEIMYQFGVSPNAYSLIIRLQLEGTEDEAVDLAAVIMKEDVNSLKRNSNFYSLFSREMLLLHFKQLFDNYEDLDNLESGWELHEGSFPILFQEYKQNKDRIGKIFERSRN